MSDSTAMVITLLAVVTIGFLWGFGVGKAVGRQTEASEWLAGRRRVEGGKVWETKL